MPKHSNPNPKPIPPKRAALHARWREHLGAWEASGLSQAAFCREQDLSVYQFRWWRRQFTKMDSAKRFDTAPLTVAPATAAFAPVRIVPSPEDQSQWPSLSHSGSWRSEWVFTNGARLRLASVPEIVLLKQLLALEEEQSCG